MNSNLSVPTSFSMTALIFVMWCSVVRVLVAPSYAEG